MHLSILQILIKILIEFFKFQTAEYPDNTRESNSQTHDYVPRRTAIGPEIRGVETTRQRPTGADPRRRINYQSPSGIGIGERIPDEAARRLAYDPSRGRTQVYDPRRQPMSNTPLVRGSICGYETGFIEVIINIIINIG